MSNLRVVVSFPEPQPSLEHQTEVLTELGQAMKSEMGLNERLSRVPEMQLPGTQSQTPSTSQEEVALRVFLLEFPDGSGCAAVLRAVGGWYMRHPKLTVSFKADGPQGGTNLKLTEFSTIAFAEVVSKINALMVPEAS